MSLIRGYHRSNEAWYGGKNENPCISIGMYDPNGGCKFEFVVKWEELIGTTLTPLISVWNDSWEAFTEFSTLFARLSMIKKTISVEEFCEILDNHGFEDLTEYTNPNKSEVEEYVEIKMTKQRAKELGLL